MNADILNANLPEEVSSKVSRLNALQREILSSPWNRKSINAEFKSICRSLAPLGYKTKHRKVRGRREWIWFAVPVDSDAFSRNTECDFVYTNTRPTYRRTLKGDCTTRAMAWCLKDELTYDQIEAMQYSYARQTGFRRNSNGTWEIVIAKRGWRTIHIAETKRSVLAAALKDFIASPVITLSSGHVAVVDVGGIVRDVWDSRGGMVNKIYAPGDAADGIASHLVDRGIHACATGIGVVLPLKGAR